MNIFYSALIALFLSFQCVRSGLAAPQPVLSESDAGALRSLPYGIASGDSLIVRSRQVKRVNSSGAGSSTKYGFAEEGGLMKEILWLRLRNAGSESWSSSAIEFESNVDASPYNSIVLWVRALESGQRFLVTLQDRSWKNKTKPQALTPYFPLWGLPPNKILQVVIPFRAVNYNSSLDYARLVRLGFQFGRKTAGNSDGDIIEILGVAFVKQEEEPSRIMFVDLNGKIDSHPSVRVKQIAPTPTPYVPPEPTEKQKVTKTSSTKSKSGIINFATEPTYFRPIAYGVNAYRDPSADSQPIGVLEEGHSYLGLRAQKVGDQMWFLVDLDSKISGWVPGAEVDFAAPKKP